jgi:hypothetical protein
MRWLEKGEWTVDTWPNVRLVHSSVCTIHDNADRITESYKCLDNIKCQQCETGTVCMHSKTTTVLSEWTVPKTMDVNLLYFYSLEISIFNRNVHTLYSVHMYWRVLYVH